MKNSKSTTGRAHRGRKKQKLSNEFQQDLKSSVNRISSLPDSILCQILSSLPTKDAVRTSILSSRWKFVWKGLFNLDFDYGFVNRACKEYPEGRKHSFLQFVNRVFHLRDVQYINDFKLGWLFRSYPREINGWIKTCMGENVHKLLLDARFVSQRIMLPSVLFTCQTLELLHLNFGFLISTPGLVSLPNLTSLELLALNYETEDCLNKVVSGCPSLIYLSIVRDANDKLLMIRICSSTLRHLEIGFDVEYRDDCDSKLEINAPALEYLDMEADVSLGCSIQRLSSLDVAKVSLSANMNYTKERCNSVVELVEALNCAKSLYLSSRVAMALSLATTQLSTRFLRLGMLEVEAECCQWDFLQSLLELSENLESLEFSVGGYHYYDEFGGPSKTCWRNPNQIPRCLISSLTKVSIRISEGFDDELAMIRYILCNGSVLRRVRLYSKQAELFKTVLNVKKKSRNCRVQINYYY